MANHHDFKDVRSVAAMTDSDDAKLVSVSVPKYKIVSYTRKHWARKRILHHHILGGVAQLQFRPISHSQLSFWALLLDAQIQFPQPSAPSCGELPCADAHHRQ